MSSPIEVLHPATLLPAGFNFRAVGVPPVRATEAAALLGPLAAFTGTFAGSGFNTIFRPDGHPQTPMPAPVTSPDPRDNVLELNLTSETLSFGAPLGSVPNRGSAQSDAFLGAVPYTQSINDVTQQVVDPALPPTGIHFEPGLWVAVPSDDGTQVASVARMASIPHGTTIDAQGTFATTAGAPNIPAVDITPSFIGGGGPFPFQSQQAVNGGTARIPQDLTPYIAAGRITQAMLTDPNSVLRDHIAGQNIIETTTITIDTTAAAPLAGGGSDNIDFLITNANAVETSATFWIETVEHVVVVPTPPRPVPPPPPFPPHPGPRAEAVMLDRAHVGLPPVWFGIPAHIPHETEITVRFTQIQYSQLVKLNFGPLTWPHVSVATLTPQEVVPPPAGGWH